MASMNPIPEGVTEADVHDLLKVGGKIGYRTAYRIWTVDQKTLSSFDAAGASLFKVEGSGWRVAETAKRSVYLFPGQLCWTK